LKILVTIVGTAILGLLATSASARDLSVTSQRIEAIWTRMDFTGGFGTVECEVTLEGTLHSTRIQKVEGRLIGFITVANVLGSPCRRGGMTILRETLPWHLRYIQFFGTLPNITSIVTAFIGAGFRIREPTFGVQCLALTTTATPGLIAFSREPANRTLVSAAAGGSIACGRFTGGLTGTTSGLEDSGGSNTAITLTLI